MDKKHWNRNTKLSFPISWQEGMENLPQRCLQLNPCWKQGHSRYLSRDFRLQFWMNLKSVYDVVGMVWVEGHGSITLRLLSECPDIPGELITLNLVAAGTVMCEPLCILAESFFHIRLSHCGRFSAGRLNCLVGNTGDSSVSGNHRRAVHWRIALQSCFYNAVVTNMD